MIDFRETTELSSALARELTAQRGTPWVATAGYNSGQRKVMGPDQAVIFLSVSDGRVSFWAGYPADTKATVKGFRCSAAVSRGAGAIARDVSRKIIDGGYLDQMGHAAKYALDCRRDHEARGATAARLASVLGRDREQAPYGNFRAFDREIVHLSNHGAGHGSLSIYGAGGYVNMDLSAVPADVAAEMLAVLARHATREN